MTAVDTAGDQPVTLPIDPLDGLPGATETALRRSVATARQTRQITTRDDAAVQAALAIAHSLDQAIAYGATLETVVKGTTALRAYLAALNLTPASRDEMDPPHVDPDPADDAPDWLTGAAEVGHPADADPA